MSAQDYLNGFSHCDTMTLVGPLFCDIVEPAQPFIDPVIFVDGGARFQQNQQGFTLGDGDSYSGILDINLDREKDFSDLAFALSVIPDHFTNIQLLGFLGGRRDHELFNLGEVHQFLVRRPSQTKVLFDECITAFSRGHWNVDVRGLFSLGALEATTLTLSGQCKYPCTEGTELTPLSSLGLSNVGHGQVSLICEGALFLFTHLEESPH